MTIPSGIPRARRENVRSGRGPDLPGPGLPGGGISADLGGVLGGLGGLLGNLAEFLEAAQQRGANLQGELPGFGDKAKGVFGMSVRVMGGQPVVENFGNIGPTGKAARPADEDVRAPLVDVFEESAAVQIVSEMPGVEEADIRWQLADGILELRADGRFRRYSRDIEIPGPTEPEKATQSFRNGVFELKLPLRSPGANGD